MISVRREVAGHPRDEVSYRTAEQARGLTVRASGGVAVMAPVWRLVTRGVKLPAKESLWDDLWYGVESARDGT